MSTKPSARLSLHYLKLSKCGWKNLDTASKCANCFTELRQQVTMQQPQATQQMPPQPLQPTFNPDRA